MKRRMFYVFAGLVLAVGPCLSAIAQDFDPVGLRVAIDAQERNNPSILSVPGVVGTGVGVNSSGRPVIKVFTETRGVRGLPRTVDGVPVQVLLTGRIFALRNECSGPPSSRPDHCNNDNDGGTSEDPIDPTARFPRPVPIGVSTGHPAVTAGTIGCRVKNLANGRVYALSNNHVYADENRANLNDNILQPGAYDGGTAPADAIGSLSDYVPIDFSGGNNVIDAAIALTAASQLGNSTPADGYGVPRSSTVAAVPGMRVQKYGRTTGQTKGRIEAINATVNVGYDSGVARFVDQIVIRGGGFSAGGDSGSLVVVQNGSNARSPVGLLFAGGAGVTIANPIDDVLGAFGVVIDE